MNHKADDYRLNYDFLTGRKPRQPTPNKAADVDDDGVDDVDDDDDGVDDGDDDDNDGKDDDCFNLNGGPREWRMMAIYQGR